MKELRELKTRHTMTTMFDYDVNIMSMEAKEMAFFAVQFFTDILDLVIFMFSHLWVGCHGINIALGYLEFWKYDFRSVKIIVGTISLLVGPT